MMDANKSFLSLFLINSHITYILDPESIALSSLHQPLQVELQVHESVASLCLQLNKKNMNTSSFNRFISSLYNA